MRGCQTEYAKSGAYNIVHNWSERRCAGLISSSYAYVQHNGKPETQPFWPPVHLEGQYNFPKQKVARTTSLASRLQVVRAKNLRGVRPFGSLLEGVLASLELVELDVLRTAIFVHSTEVNFPRQLLLDFSRLCVTIRHPVASFHVSLTAPSGDVAAVPPDHPPAEVPAAEILESNSPVSFTLLPVAVTVNRPVSTAHGALPSELDAGTRVHHKTPYAHPENFYLCSTQIHRPSSPINVLVVRRVIHNEALVHRAVLVPVGFRGPSREDAAASASRTHHDFICNALGYSAREVFISRAQGGLYVAMHRDAAVTGAHVTSAFRVLPLLSVVRDSYQVMRPEAVFAVSFPVVHFVQQLGGRNARWAFRCDPIAALG